LMLLGVESHGIPPWLKVSVGHYLW